MEYSKTDIENQTIIYNTKSNEVSKFKTKIKSLIMIIIIVYLFHIVVKKNDNSMRRNLRTLGHSHHKSCKERDFNKYYQECCYEDIKCWDDNIPSSSLLNDRINSKGKHIYEYSSNDYTNCLELINNRRHRLFNDFNKYMGGNLTIDKINYYHHYYLVNMTKCVNSQYGCCTIKNSCENKIWTISQLRKTNNTNTDGCPKISTLWIENEKWNIYGYPDEEDNSVIIVIIMIVILILWNIM